jgi:hypothetical protein
MIDTTLSTSHDALHRVAVHVVARARLQASGRFSLRVTSRGLGTPEFGPDQRRVRISGGLVVVESDAPGAAVARARSIDGASLRQIAEFAGVDLGLPLDVGHDTPPLGDIDAPIEVDGRVAAELEGWYSLVGGVLDRVVAELTAKGLEASLPRLWPEHFDIAIETEARPGRRVNLGGSPGDGFCAEPYLYVGPWTPDRPGDRQFWNAPFGAFVPASALHGDDIASGAVEFLLDGVARLR